MNHLHSSQFGEWRVNLDIDGGRAVVAVGEPVAEILERILAESVPVCVVDLAAAYSAKQNDDLFVRLVARWPGRLWIAGGLDAASGLSWLGRGAAGVVLGSSLIHGDHVDSDALSEISPAARDGRVVISLDSLDGRVTTNAFTRDSLMRVESAVEQIVGVLGTGWQLLYVDILASRRHSGPNWRPARILAERHVGLPIWYGGALASWSDVAKVWDSGLRAVVGRAYFEGELGLP